MKVRGAASARVIQEPESFIALDMAATGLLFLRFLEGRGMRICDEDSGEPISHSMLALEALRFARGEEWSCSMQSLD